MIDSIDQETARPALAILDWGIGGMDFYRIFKESQPETGICYFSDAGAVPYGKQHKEQLIHRLGRVAGFLQQKGVSSLVVACNAMSTVLPAALSAGKISGFRITGVIEPTLQTVLPLQGEKVGVVGGRRTILSGAYGKSLRKRFRSVTQRIAQPLSAMIERGEKDTPAFLTTLEKIMEPLHDEDILVLACTHYPAALEGFKVLVPSAKIISPTEETFRWVSEHWRFDGKTAADVFYTTGDPEEMRRASASAFGVTIGEITKINL